MLTALAGTFEDGSGPLENYENNDNCNWLISPQSNSDSIIRITINFNRFNTESANDLVKIYKGATTSDSLVATFSGDNIPPSVVINGAQALITFTTNGNNPEPGWYISYSTKSYDWCSGMTTYTDPQGTLTDGSSTYNYRNSSTCRWEITPASGDPVRLVFNSFKTEASNDYVRILDLQSGQLLAEYSGDFSASTPPPSVVSLSGKMYILFTTNSSVTDEGWNASWTTYPLGVQERQNLQYQVFPNPASGKVYIQMYESSKKELSLEFISIDGKVQLSENFTTTEGLNRKAIDISGLQAGIYVLRIIGDDGMVTRKVVVE
jgi:hypothetical protein